MSNPKRAKVAVIGGGCAGMAAAFELTRGENRDRYEVTVYQTGWRLGGKGASGRGASGRVEEHGLHLWMGYYENAFRLMRECYEELGRDRAVCPIADWSEAFVPANAVTSAERGNAGRWKAWTVNLPPGPGLPGDSATIPVKGGTVADYLRRTIGLLGTLLRSVQSGEATAPGPGANPHSADSRSWSSSSLGDSIGRLLNFGALGSLTTMLEGLTFLQLALEKSPLYPRDIVLRLVTEMSQVIRSQAETFVRQDNDLRRIWEVADVSLATLCGAVRTGLLTDPRGFDAIDGFECRDWLRENGASARSLDSGFLRGLYDFGFAYEDGDPARPRISAAAALRGANRLFYNYRGAFFWKLTAGMGDVVFAPLYQVLKRRGVRFEFFHRLANVGLGKGDGAASRSVEDLRFDVQARIADGVEYDPLVDVLGVPSWPNKAHYGQLVDGEMMKREGWAFESAWEERKAGTRVLKRGQDFDLVVLAIGGGAVPRVCGEILERDDRWRAAVEWVKSVPIQSFQIWMNQDMQSLGWNEGSVSVSGFAKPFDTWADMSHVIKAERWRTPPRSLVYFCSAMHTPGGVMSRRPEEWNEVLRSRAVDFLNKEITHLWPKAASATGKFRWDLLVDPAGKGRKAADESRFASQHYTANVNPSDWYTLALPGSRQYRLSPLDTTYANLRVAGDWTDSKLNLGSVEAAVMSGMLAAHSVSGSPALSMIVGYDYA